MGAAVVNWPDAPGLFPHPSPDESPGQAPGGVDAATPGHVAARRPAPGMNARRGRLFVVSAPSGAGKTSLLAHLLDGGERLKLSVSHTTRPGRKGEVDGRDYHFVDAATFARMARDGDFLEHARVYDYDYGTSRRFVERELARGYDIVLEIDWQGARQVMSRMKEGVSPGVSIFILPPSEQALRERLTHRNLDTRQVIERRMEEAMREMSHCNEFDHIVVNDDFDRACGDLRRILDGREPDAGARARLVRTLQSLGLEAPRR